MAKALLVLTLVLVTVVLLFRFAVTPEKTSAPLVVREESTQKETIDPFFDLTIPYLRARSYKSSLGPLKPYKEYGSYTAYLTSYTSDNLTINGLLTIPKGDGPHPAIVFVHGYIAPTIYKTTERYGDYVDALAKQGFVVFKIDLRGHGSSEGEPGGAYYSSDYVVDTLNAYAALSASDFVDTKHIGLWGHSMAGNVVSRALAVKPEIPATVIWAGAGYTYKDLLSYGLQDNSYRPPSLTTARQEKRAKLRALHGEFTESDPFWKTVAIPDYLPDITGAVGVHHAIDDTVVNISYSRDLASLLEKNNVTYEYFEYKSGGHNLSGGSFSQAMQRTIDFYKKYLF